jgi:3-hydroxyacyl-CoA dehydrogenase
MLVDMGLDPYRIDKIIAGFGMPMGPFRYGKLYCTAPHLTAPHPTPPHRAAPRRAALRCATVFVSLCFPGALGKAAYAEAGGVLR